MKTNERLFCLDLLRGFDMLLLTVVAPMIRAVDKVWGVPKAVTDQLTHNWGGFTLYDLIMPLFIFICGAALPYALGRRLDAQGRPTAAYWKHVGVRVALLWFCGLLCQGNLATLDALKISPYNNTLQTIAAGYLITAVVYVVPVRLVRQLAPVVLAVAYAFLLILLGDLKAGLYSETGNYAQIFEQKVLAVLLPAGSEAFNTHGYTWFLTTLMFGAMTLCGAQCAEILRSAWTPRRKALVLAGLGAALLAVGWGLASGIPVIKHIFTVSFTAQAMGWSVLALAGLYALTDLAGCRRGWWLVTLYGQCALTAYMATHFFSRVLQAAANTVVAGVPHLIGDKYQPLVLMAAVAVILTLVLVVRRRLRGGDVPAAAFEPPAARPRPAPAAPAAATPDEPIPLQPRSLNRSYATDGGEGKPLRSTKTTLRI